MAKSTVQRRTFLRWTIGLGVAGLVHVSPVVGQTNVIRFDSNMAERMLDLNGVELRIQLQNGLRIFTAEQQAFLNQVLTAVENGVLPRSMVNMVYVWSIRRNPNVPFPYFEVAMRALAERRGVVLS